jgi:3-oxoacyl-[acyl-carrier-protein] synthase II
MRRKKSLITGLGVVSPIGIGKDAYWQNLCAGKSGFRLISLFDTAGLRLNTAGQISDLQSKEILGNINLMDLDRATILLSSAAKLALDDSGLKVSENNSKEIGVSVGTTFGSLYSISEFDKESFREGPRYVNPSVFPSTVGNSAASRISIFFKIKGFNATVSTGMCAGLDAIDYARDALTLERVKIVLSGAVEALSPQIFLGFYKLNYLSWISCPFDRRRSGIMLSEGSSVVVLEDPESVKKRKARIYAQILGTGSVFDPGKYYKYSPQGKGMREAMGLALKDAGLKPHDISCVFANANSTKDADLIETGAIKEVFGKHARKLPVTAIKSTLGETYSASGGLSLVAAVMALNSGIIPPTINLIEKDPECDLDYVCGAARCSKIGRVMVNAFGPDGGNTSVIIGRP